MNTNNAESKLAKFGETLTDNADGNPEPNIEEFNMCVETRQRVCKRCGDKIPDTKYKNAIYCSTTCSNQNNSYNYRIKHGLIKKPGVGSGGNQLRTNNHMWKDGIGTFQKIAFEHYPHYCTKCKSVEHLCVHHIDHNRHNNTIENLTILCKKCHQDHHTKRDLKTGRYIKV